MTEAMPTLSRFFRWWVNELLACVPAPLRRIVGADTPRFAITVDGRVLTILRVDGASLAPTQTFQAGPDDAIGNIARGFSRRRRPRALVGIEADQTLESVMLVPKAARRNLRQVVTFQVGKRTPFDPTEVAVSFRLLEAPAPDGQLRVAYTIVPRHVVENSVAMAKRAGFDVAGMFSLAASNWRDSILEFDRSSAPRSSSRIAGIALVGLCLLAAALAAAAIYLPFARQQRELDVLNHALVNARDRARQAADVRTEIDRLQQQQDFALGRKLAQLSALAVLRDLTESIPDDSWVTKLTIEGNEVRLQAFAPSAPALVARLAEREEFEAVALVSKVAREAGVNLDSFQLTLHVVTPDR